MRGGVGDVQAMRGKRQEVGGGRARAGVPRPRVLSIGAGRKTTGEGQVGWAETAGPPGKWASGKSLLPFYFFLFSIFAIMF